MMIFQKRTYLVLLLFVISTAVIAQREKNSKLYISEVPTIQPGDTHIRLPQVSEGYHLLLKGSDHNPIVDSSGRIVKPLEATKLSLYFQLIKNGEDTATEDLSKIITVPGKYAENNKNNPKPFVIPALREWHGGTGDFLLKKSSKIVLRPQDENILQKAADILQNDIVAQTGLHLKIVFGTPRKGDIFLTLQEKDAAIGKEGYYFKAGDFISISAIAYQGLFWGTRTLLQLLGQNKAIPQGIARDYPEFKVRGFVLDDGRKFFRLEFLRNYVKLLSYYKMNDFQIHLNDNGFVKFFGNNWDSTYSGFRLENDTYPNLANKGESYTKQEFRELQQLADDYAVQVVPEIDVPAHSLAFTKAIPAIGSKKYGMDHLDLHNPLTDTVIENVFKEYLSGSNPVFTGNTIDIGTDEYAKADAEAFRAFTDRMIKYVQSFGKKVRLWGALSWAKGSTPVTVKGVTMNTWYNGYANPIDMKKLGYNQISTPDGWLYIVPAAGYYYDYLNLENLYNKWTPSMIGNVKFQPGDPTIVGGSFAEWNDIVGNGISEQDVTDRVFPAVQVLAQKMWGGADTSMTYAVFAQHSKNVGEGPSLNMRGKLGNTADTLVVDYDFDKKDKNIKTNEVGYVKGANNQALSFFTKNSTAILPYIEIGYNYTVSFWINPDKNNQANATLFSSPNAVVKLKQGNTGCLGFSREGYDFNFNYTVPTNIWTHIVITGTNKGTSLYVNGKLQDKLYDRWIQKNDVKKTKVRKVETLFFPLRKIGGFVGKLDEVKVWNKVLNDKEISAL